MMLDDSGYEEEVKPLSAIGHVVDSIGLDCRPVLQHQCRRCQMQIYDKYMVRIDSAVYHEGCVRCSVCDAALAGKCFQHSGQLFCRMHYYKECSDYRCAGCKTGLSPTDMVYKLKTGIIYHVACHRCFRCGRELTPGDAIVVDDVMKAVACMSHYTPTFAPAPEHEINGGAGLLQVSIMSPSSSFDVSIVEMAGTSSSSSTGASGATLPSDGLLPQASFDFPFSEMSIKRESISPPQRRKEGLQVASSQPNFSTFDAYAAYSEFGDDESKYLKRRGPRTTIKQNQLDVLNRIFASTPKPSKHARAKLALETGLSMRVIQVWFQNRRSKERRLKHLCNYLRHYEQRGLIPPPLAFPPGEGPGPLPPDFSTAGLLSYDTQQFEEEDDDEIEMEG